MPLELIAHPEALQTERTQAAEMLVRDSFDDVWARGNARDMRLFATADFRFEPPPGYKNDIRAYERMVADVHKAFPDLYADLYDVVAGPGKAAAHWMMGGTHEGEWIGIPATHREVRMEGISFMWLRDGLICREVTAQDNASLLLQLGVGDLSVLQQPSPI